MSPKEAILIRKAEDMSEQRVKFAIRANSGKEEMKALCQEFEISRPTGYLWLKRYRECGRLQELAEISRRPHRSPKQTAVEQEQRVIALRKQYPDWGALKLAELLKREQVAIPRITVHRILLRNGLPGARQGSAPGCDAALPAGRAQSTVADGFQRNAGHATGLRAAGGVR